MENIYLLADWTAATKMKNQLHPNWSIEVEVLTDMINGEKEVIGHQIMIVERNDLNLTRPIDKYTTKVITSFYVDYGAFGFKSYSISEAIAILKCFGYSCSFNTSAYEVPDDMKPLLQNLYDLGYRTIRRTNLNREKDIFITSKEDVTSLDDFRRDPHTLEQVLAKEVNYNKFRFLPVNENLLIKGLLELE